MYVHSIPCVSPVQVQVKTTANTIKRELWTAEAAAGGTRSACVGNSTGSCPNACFSCFPVSWAVVASTGQDINGVSWGTLRTPDGQGYIYSVVPLTDTTSPYAPEVPPLNTPYNGVARPTRDVSLRKPDIPTLQHFPSTGRTFIINNIEGKFIALRACASCCQCLSECDAVRPC